MMFIGYDVFGNNSYFHTELSHPSYAKATLSKGQFDELYIDENTLIDDSLNKPDGWGYATVLDAKFNGNLEGGSVSANGSVIKTIKLQRRISTEIQWLDIGEFTYSDKLYYEIVDKYVQNDFTYQYALVPLTETVEGLRSISDSVRVDFEGTFLSDNENNYRLLYNTKLGVIEHNNPSSLFEPLQAQYPIVAYSTLNYRKSNFTALFLSAETKSDQVNIYTEKQSRDKLLSFLKNRKPKIFRSQNGEMLLISIVDNPQEQHDDKINGIATVTFSFVEIGEINSETLSANGLMIKAQEVF